MSAVKKAIKQTIVGRRKKDFRDDCREQEDRARHKTGSAGDNFHDFSDDEETESETEESLVEQELRYASDGKTEFEAMIGLCAARKKLQRATTSIRLYMNCNNGRERVQPNRPTSIQELKKVTTCNRCGALGGWEDECPQKGQRRRS